MKALNLITGAQNKTAKEREKVKELPTIGDVWELVVQQQNKSRHINTLHKHTASAEQIKSHTEGVMSRVC